jgi:hypothetical protein
MISTETKRESRDSPMLGEVERQWRGKLLISDVLQAIPFLIHDDQKSRHVSDISKMISSSLTAKSSILSLLFFSLCLSFAVVHVLFLWCSLAIL